MITALNVRRTGNPREPHIRMLFLLLLTLVSEVSSDQLKGTSRKSSPFALTNIDCYNHGPGMLNSGSKPCFESNKGNNYTIDIPWQSYVKRPNCIGSLEMRVNGGIFQSLADAESYHKVFYSHKMPECQLKLRSYKVTFRYEEQGKRKSFSVSGKNVNVNKATEQDIFNTKKLPETAVVNNTMTVFLIKNLFMKEDFIPYLKNVIVETQERKISVDMVSSKKTQNVTIPLQCKSRYVNITYNFLYEQDYQVVKQIRIPANKEQCLSTEKRNIIIGSAVGLFLAISGLIMFFLMRQKRKEAEKVSNGTCEDFNALYGTYYEGVTYSTVTDNNAENGHVEEEGWEGARIMDLNPHYES